MGLLRPDLRARRGKKFTMRRSWYALLLLMLLFSAIAQNAPVPEPLLLWAKRCF